MARFRQGTFAFVRSGAGTLVVLACLAAAPPDAAPRQPVPPEDLAPAPRSIPDDGLSAPPGPRPPAAIPTPCQPPDLNAAPPPIPLQAIDLPNALRMANA